MCLVSWELINSYAKERRSMLSNYLDVNIILLFVKFLIYRYDRKWKTEELTRIRRDLTIGYGGTTICGIYPQIILLIHGLSPNFFSSLFLCTFLTGVFIVLFVTQHLMEYKPGTSRSKATKIEIIALALHLIFGITVYWISMNDCAEEYMKLTKIIIGQFLVCYTLTGMEFCMVCFDGIRYEWPPEKRPMLRRSFNSLMQTFGIIQMTSETSQWRVSLHQRTHFPWTESSQNLKTVEPKIIKELDAESEDQVNPNANGIECNICFREYNNTTVIPRFLIGCGHTLCQGCVGSLTKNQNNAVHCPFCRKSTVVPGGLSNALPKNFAVLEIIESKKTEKI